MQCLHLALCPPANMFLLSFLPLVAQVLVLAFSVASDIRYVRPADSPLSSCPGQPCLTLHEYVELDNFTNGTSLQFLPGNHTLQQSFRLKNISNIMFVALFNRSITNIICKDNVTINISKVTHLNIVGLTFILSRRFRGDGSVLEFSTCKFVFISDTSFQGSEEVTGRAIKVVLSRVNILRCVFKSLTTVTDLVHVAAGGGAIHSTNAHLIIYDSSFFNNVGYWGGAINVRHSNLLLNGTIFDGNSAKRGEGAIAVSSCQIVMVGNNTFYNNSCQEKECFGGAMFFLLSKLSIPHGIGYFHFNKAVYGGAIFLETSHASFGGRVTMLKNKAHLLGGALVIYSSELVSNCEYLNLIANSAGEEGGAMYVFGKVTLFGNVTLHGNVAIENNTALRGGGIRTYRSHIRTAGNCSLTSNNATSGGAMFTMYGEVSLQGHTHFMHNTAIKSGGAMYAAGTALRVIQHVEFSFNSAKYGGAMFFENGASLNLINQTGFRGIPFLASSFNIAHQYGGVIYHKDSPSFFQCSYMQNAVLNLPNCFLQFQHISYESPSIVSRNDSAGREGDFMFGGLMDRCKINEFHKGQSTLNSGAISIYPHSLPTPREISSKPTSLCLCTINSHTCSSRSMDAKVFRGQNFTVPLLTEMQYGITATNVTAITSSTARLETYQTSQPLPDYCAPLSYTVYSIESHEQVVLYPDGPCRDTGTARVVIDVTLLPCPDGFTQSSEICTCEDRLHGYISSVSCQLYHS